MDVFFLHWVPIALPPHEIHVSQLNTLTFEDQKSIIVKSAITGNERLSPVVFDTQNSRSSHLKQVDNVRYGMRTDGFLVGYFQAKDFDPAFIAENIYHLAHDVVELIIECMEGRSGYGVKFGKDDPVIPPVIIDAPNVIDPSASVEDRIKELLEDKRLHELRPCNPSTNNKYVFNLSAPLFFKKNLSVARDKSLMSAMSFNINESSEKFEKLVGRFSQDYLLAFGALAGPMILVFLIGLVVSGYARTIYGYLAYGAVAAICLVFLVIFMRYHKRIQNARHVLMQVDRNIIVFSQYSNFMRVLDAHYLKQDHWDCQHAFPDFISPLGEYREHLMNGIRNLQFMSATVLAASTLFLTVMTVTLIIEVESDVDELPKQHSVSGSHVER